MNGKRMRRSDVKMPGVGRGNNPNSHKKSSKIVPKDSVVAYARLGSGHASGSPAHRAHFENLEKLLRLTYGSDKATHRALAKHHDKLFDAAKTAGDAKEKAAQAKLSLIHEHIGTE